MLRSYSWSTNVAGRKRWLLLAPCHTHLLFDRFGQHMAPDFSPETAAGAPPVCTVGFGSTLGFSTRTSSATNQLLSHTLYCRRYAALCVP